MKHLKTISLIALMLCFSAVAQEKNDNKKSKFQVSFGYPLGTHGSATDYINEISFNILYGFNGGVDGFEYGGIFNYNSGNVKGFQMAGVANINKLNTKGFQMSGIANINKLDTKGFQLSTANITLGNIEGLQLGVFNVAKKVKGLQIGVFNYRENDDDGISFGVFNIIKNGYYAIETTSSEVLYANTNYKMGSEKLYTIFKLGYSSYKSKPVYSYGVGFGRLFSISEKKSISTDLSYNKIVYDNDWSINKNDLYKLDINYNLKLVNKFSLIAGPSLNYYNTDQKVDGKFGTLKLPYTISEKTNANSQQSFWVGLNVGINYQF